MGDGLIAVWEGCDQAEDCAAALRAALAIRAGVEADNAGRIRRGQPAIRLRLGIHVGLLVATPLGQAGRLGVAVRGTVNVAQRLEEAARYVATDAAVAVLASAAVVTRAGVGFRFAEVGSCRYAGVATRCWPMSSPQQLSRRIRITLPLSVAPARFQRRSRTDGARLARRPQQTEASAPVSVGVLIVGGGQAGFQVAASLRADGYDGPIRLIGAESHPPYQRPPLSKGLLLGKMDRARLLFRQPSYYPAQAIELLLGAMPSTASTGRAQTVTT